MSLLKKLGIGSGFEKISPAEAHGGQQAGELIIVDVRDAGEWSSTGTPLGSHRISLSDIQLSEKCIQTVAHNKDAKLAISCLSGVRSRSAAKVLSKNGFSNLKIVKGGIRRWKAQGFPIDD